MYSSLALLVVVAAAAGTEEMSKKNIRKIKFQRVRAIDRRSHKAAQLNKAYLSAKDSYIYRF